MAWNNIICSFTANVNAVGKAAWKINHNLYGGGFSNTGQHLVMVPEQHRERTHDCSCCADFKDKGKKKLFFIVISCFFSLSHAMLYESKHLVIWGFAQIV